MNISVLLPVYNAGSFLRLAIESILAQDFMDFEFIIIDDASDDDSAEIIREYAGKDPRIRPFFHQSNLGLVKTLNEGLEAARGEFVARMDADDEALPHRLRTQYLFMKSRSAVAVAGSYIVHMGKTRYRDRLVRLPTASPEIVRTLESENCIYHPSVMMRRESIISLGGYRPEFRHAEDYDLWLRVSQSYEIANIPVALLRYRINPKGYTLSRPWVQLYYVFLAQILYKGGENSFADYEQITQKRLDQINKTDFMITVAKGTSEELIRLGFLSDTLNLLRHFSKDIGWQKTLSIVVDIIRRRREIMSIEGDDWFFSN